MPPNASKKIINIFSSADVLSAENGGGFADRTPVHPHYHRNLGLPASGSSIP
jgi:hypothetical protein